ncbi:MAG: FAD-binding oxidoreductase [Gammaproteobacteria bacterium]|nr:FAD-binding oxidoreductase [Gammaproteobacteria bacterium]NNF50746.1 FAD-binding oxidoreductase [Woeseiaceae bacterium]MBT8093616.1 FAD-binding oxidoreductase [Gammaproteobacteria bacterium]MBT8106324.1 FAD-binding oxidoreductase [Gammaproteobacteria bacterium]NNK26338.1 FAD-binding oxidoreductase [Woeseiaceae bacterium]
MAAPNGPGYPDSYYVATAQGIVDRPALDEELTADVCVIGGGFTGLSAALTLAELGVDVIVLEAERVGFGASGRCGGLVGTGQRKDVLEMEEAFGLERSRQFWDFAEQAKQEIRDRVARHAIPCDLQKGQLIGVHKRGYLGWAEALVDALTGRYDYPFCRALSAEETREYVATEDFLEGLYDPEAMVLHPLNYALGIARAAEEAGVRIFENSRVRSYTESDPAVVRTDKGSVTASHVVLGCNGYLGNLEPRTAGKIMPINNFMIATEPLGEERALELVKGRFGIHDTRFVVNYFRLSEDFRLLFGGGENYRPGFPRDIAGFVRPYMLKVLPQLRGVKIDYAWGGTLSVTVSRLPHVGRLEPNVWYAQGYSGHGIPTANFAGKIVGEAISGVDNRFDAFASLPSTTFPGGTTLRYPGMVLAMLYYGLKDRL